MRRRKEGKCDLVAVPPTWVVVPSDRETRLGQSAVLDCQVEGFPQPSVTWKKAAGRQLKQTKKQILF